MNLGAIVTTTKGKATHITHIIGTIIISVLSSEKLSTKNITFEMQDIEFDLNAITNIQSDDAAGS